VWSRLIEHTLGSTGPSGHEHFEYFQAQTFRRAGKLTPGGECGWGREDVMRMFERGFLAERNERETKQRKKRDDGFHQAATSQTEHLRSVGAPALPG
jgi:hypothetical protein